MLDFVKSYAFDMLRRLIHKMQYSNCSMPSVLDLAGGLFIVNRP